MRRVRSAIPYKRSRPVALRTTKISTAIRIRELVDHLDGRPVQMIDRHELVVTELTDGELYLIAAGGRTKDELEMKVIPPTPSKD